MVSMSTGFSGLTDAQADLVNYWQDCCQYGRPPMREQLDPGAIRAHLSAISIVEMSAQGETKFRLVGSGLRQIFGREMRGRYLSELDSSSYEMWSLGLARALDVQQPIGGMITREYDSHAWLRLPFECDQMGMVVLCHDTLVPNMRLGLHADRQSHKSRAASGNLAA
jgi:PAS domain